jgi:hypothetical protein
MKHRTSELSGALLDAAVALAEKLPWMWFGGYGKHVVLLRERPAVQSEQGPGFTAYAPSDHWIDGGPIIEREGIALVREGGMWDAHVGGYYCHDDGVASIHDFEVGSTPLIAAMRAYVGSKLGPEVELP